MTSMAIHETPPEIRRAAIRETSRVLKKNGLFVLVDWSNQNSAYGEFCGIL